MVFPGGELEDGALLTPAGAGGCNRDKGSSACAAAVVRFISMGEKLKHHNFLCR